MMNNTWEQLNNTATYEVEKLKPRYFIGGVDLSGSVDLTAAKAIFRIPDDPYIYVMSMYWIPEELVEQKVHQDQIPYDLWIEQGILPDLSGK